jgi:hypothetical protein
MSLRRKLVAGGAVLLIAGAVTGAGLAASGHGRNSSPAPRQLHLAHLTKGDFLRATALYLGTDVTTLRHEAKAGRTLAVIAAATPGRSTKQLTAFLVHAAAVRLALSTDRALSGNQVRLLHTWLERRVTGFLTDTCPLSLAGLARHLGGCAGMMTT